MRINAVGAVAGDKSCMQEAPTIDVRDDVRAGRSPLPRILEAAGRLRHGQSLRLIAPFEPVRLFAVMAERGFCHAACLTISGDWQVLFTRGPDAPKTERIAPTAPPAQCGAVVLEVDARELEPPQPLVVILEALARLPEGQSLRASTDRRPMHLYPLLVERGFTAATEEQEDGSFVTTIQRA